MDKPATVQKSAVYQKKRPGASRWANKWIQSPSWFLGFAIAVALCLAIYALNALLGRVHPGSTWGLSYGVAATVLFVAVMFWSIKRRTMRIRALGRAWYYLQVHVYGGVLFLLLMFMHTGFGWPQGVLTWWLWALSIWIVGTGLLGIFLQKWIPTLLNSGLTTEVNFDRIPELVEASSARAEKLVRDADPVVREFYQKNVAPELAAPRPRLIYFFDITGGQHRVTQQFQFLSDLLPSDEEATLDDLQEIYRTKLEMDAHYTLQRLLRSWMYLHVPVSIVLIVLLCYHIFAVIYY